MKYNINIKNKNDIKQFKINHNKAKELIKYTLFKIEVGEKDFNKLKDRHQIGEARIKELKEEFIHSYKHNKESINTIMLFDELEEVYNKVNNNNLKIIEAEIKRLEKRGAVINSTGYYRAVKNMGYRNFSIH